MMSRIFLSFCLFLSVFSISAQGRDVGNHQYVIRGEVYVDLEPIYAGHVDSEYPLDISAASRRALEEAAMFFSAMIYGWSFHYDVGERARRIDEILELTPVSRIEFGDPALKVTDTEIRDMRLRVWADYHLNDALQRRMQVWRSGTIRNAQGIGYSPSHVDEYPGWLALKKIALDDAARSALRAMLRGSERNRPKEVTGFISLASFPRYYIESGRWAVSARFRVQIMEIIPFAAY
ncbi:MAG: hypothetical protein FWD26_10290 [Treponema sp.]|nr:hypothetical protein [Treponema sp.]